MLNRCCNAQRFSGSEHALRPVNTAVFPRSAPVGSSLARRNVPSGKDQGETAVFAWSGFVINFFLCQIMENLKYDSTAPLKNSTQTPGHLL